MKASPPAPDVLPRVVVHSPVIYWWTERRIKTCVDAALAMLFARDVFLLEHGTGERAVVAKLASYMAPLFRGYDVDVEYNRQGLDPLASKVLTLGPECRGGGREEGLP